MHQISIPLQLCEQRSWIAQLAMWQVSWQETKKVPILGDVSVPYIRCWTTRLANIKRLMSYFVTRPLTEYRSKIKKVLLTSLAVQENLRHSAFSPTEEKQYCFFSLDTHLFGLISWIALYFFCPFNMDFGVPTPQFLERKSTIKKSKISTRQPMGLRSWVGKRKIGLS